MTINWKYLPGNTVVFRTDEQGTYSMSVEAQEFLAWLDEGNVPLPADEPDLQSAKADMVKEIDERFEAIYGYFTRFKDEYQAGEAAARAYKAAGYSGAVSVFISSYAQAANISNRAAADTIIAQADAAYVLIPTLRAIRMKKYNVLATATLADAKTLFNNLMGEVAPIAATIGL